VEKTPKKKQKREKEKIKKDCPLKRKNFAKARRLGRAKTAIES